MAHSFPTVDALKSLVHAAEVFQRDQPWDHLHDAQPFGVRDPHTKRVVLALVSGHVGGTFGLTAFPGFDGFLTLREVLEGRVSDSSGMRALLCAFVARSRLTAGDRQLLKWGCSGALPGERFPQFESWLPGYLPWGLDAEEARLLTLVLQQSLNVARDAAFNPRLFEGGPPRTYLTRWNMRDGDEAPEAYEWANPDFGNGPPKQAPVPDEITAARLMRLPIDPDAEWEVSVVPGPDVLHPNSGDRPELIYTLFIADHESGYLHRSEPLPASTAFESLQKSFVDTLLRLGFAPRRVLVNDIIQRGELAPVTKLVRSKLLRVQRLAMVERAAASLREFMLSHR